jgi:hypothetical protein
LDLRKLERRGYIANAVNQFWLLLALFLRVQEQVLSANNLRMLRSSNKFVSGDIAQIFQIIKGNCPNILRIIWKI